MQDNTLHLKRALQVALLAAYLVCLVLPGYIFTTSRGLLAIDNWQTASQLLFPLAGLYSFSLVAMQLLIGANMRWLRRVFGRRLLDFHRYQGLFALVLVITHPLLIIGGFGLANTLQQRGFVAPSLAVYTLYGWAALLIITTTVTTAVIAWKLGRLSRVWRVIHLANYAAFALGWWHSWSIGSDIQTSQLRYIWIFYALAATASLVARIGRASSKTVPPG